MRRRISQPKKGDMVTTLIVAALFGQYYLPTPAPIFNPEGYQLRYDGFGYVNGPFAPPVGRPQLIELAGVEEVGRVERIDTIRQLITVRLPGEVVVVHYGPKTVWHGVLSDLKPGVMLSINETKRRITIMGKDD